MGVPGRIHSRGSLGTSLSPFLGASWVPRWPPTLVCSHLPKSGNIRLFLPLELPYFAPHCRPLIHPAHSRGPRPLDGCLLLPPPSSPAQNPPALPRSQQDSLSLLRGNDTCPKTHAHLLRWIHKPPVKGPQLRMGGIEEAHEHPGKAIYCSH